MSGGPPQPSRPGPRPGAWLRWIGVLILLLVAAGAVAYGILSTRKASTAYVGRGSSSAKAIAAAAAAGDARFNRGAARCHLRPLDRHPTGGLLLGLSASLRLFDRAARCEETRLAQATGVQAVRDDVSWAVTEPEPGHYNWNNYDAVVTVATQAGLMVLPVIDDSPRWAAPSGDSLPSNPSGYAAFVAAVVRRYGPGGTFWRAHARLPQRPVIWYELWNEPYYAPNPDPGEYARMVRVAVTAGRAANPAARFLIEADTSYQTASGDRADWIAGMYAAVPGLGQYFDALAIHPYGGDPLIYTPLGDTDDQPGRLALAHEELASHGDGDKPLWVTEIGWSTCLGAESCVSEAQQAAYLRSFLRLARTSWKTYVRAVFVYDLRDQAPNPIDDPAAWFGLLRPDLSPKPAWQVLHEAAASAS